MPTKVIMSGVTQPGRRAQIAFSKRRSLRASRFSWMRRGGTEAGGGSESERLRHAVAYGSAAASLPGTTLPTPEQIDLAAVSVSAADAASPIPVPTELA